MADMLVKLYTLPELAPTLSELRTKGIEIRRALAPEMPLVVDWVRTHFSAGWATECQVTFARQPIACFIAVADEQIVGFACHDAICRNFFGPTGVDENARKQGIGNGLLLACLHAMAAQGYGYAIIGWAGPTTFYEKTVGAVEIEGSEPGIYRGMLHE